MYALLIYSLKAGVCLAVFYLFFKLLLSRETFHRLNRIVVLAALVLSFVLPLCVITVYRELPALPEVTTLPMPETVAASAPVPAAAPFPWEKVAGGLFLVGAGVTLVWTLASLFGVLRLIRRGRRERLEDGSVLVHLGQPVTPFSWGRYIVLSEEDLAENGAAIVQHERAHLRLRHSVDLLITDIAGCLQWFNPAMWLLRRELRAIHEYEADEAVLDSGVDARQYQLLLIKKAAGSRWYSVANSFNHSKLKNRIDMMLRKRSSRWAGAKALFLLPLTGLALGAFARTAYVYPDDKSSLPQLTITNLIPANTVLGKPLILVDGREVESLDSLDADGVASVTVLKDASATALYGSRAVNGVIVVTLKEKGAPAEKKTYTIGGSDGQTSIVIRETETDASKSSDKTSIRIEGYKGALNGRAAKVNFGGLSDTGKVWIVDGRKVVPAELEMLDPSRIVSMSVAKGTGVAAEYGDDTATSVIKITTKDPANATEEALQSAVEGIESAREGLEASRRHMSRKEWKRVRKQLDKAQREIDAARSEMASEMAAARKEMEAARRYLSSDAWKEAQKAIAKVQKQLSDPETRAKLDEAQKVLNDPAVREKLEEAQKVSTDPEVRAKLEEAKKVLNDPEVRAKLEEAQKQLAVSEVQGVVAEPAADESVAADGNTTRKLNGMVVQAYVSGETPGENKIVVRGSDDISFEKGTKPLYIIDGKIVKDGEKGDDLLDPLRIENITVLKDKSSVEKYGKKAANGVILITTKK